MMYRHLTLTLLLALPSASAFSAVRSSRHGSPRLSVADKDVATTSPISTCYGFMAGALVGSAAACLFAGPSTAVMTSTALAALVDFGPSATRDWRTSKEASEYAVEELIRASPPGFLVDNFVQNLGPEPDEAAIAAKAEATSRLAASNRFSLLVRARVFADLVGGLLMCSRTNPCLGASFILGGHSLCWASGMAAARIDRRAQARPLSPPLARIIGVVTATLAAAALGGLAPQGTRWRAACAYTYAVGLAIIELARLVADRTRARTHVGI